MTFHTGEFFAKHRTTAQLDSTRLNSTQRFYGAQNALSFEHTRFYDCEAIDPRKRWAFDGTAAHSFKSLRRETLTKPRKNFLDWKQKQKTIVALPLNSWQHLAQISEVPSAISLWLWWVSSLRSRTIRQGQGQNLCWSLQCTQPLHLTCIVSQLIHDQRRWKIWAFYVLKLRLYCPAAKDLGLDSGLSPVLGLPIDLGLTLVTFAKDFEVKVLQTKIRSLDTSFTLWRWEAGDSCGK